LGVEEYITRSQEVILITLNFMWLQKLLYASVVWWPIVSRVEARNLLQSLQGSYLRRATVGSTRMTPTKVLEVVLCQIPLDLAATGAAGLSA
jgi:hypothetical protein